MVSSDAHFEPPGDARNEALAHEVDRLVADARRLCNIDPGQALAVADVAVELAGQVGPARLIDALNGRASAYMRLFRFNEAEADLSLAHELCEHHGEKSRLGAIEMQRGTVRWYQGETASAYEHYRTALDIAERHGDLKTAASCLNNIGLVHTRTGDYAAALEAQLAALEHFRTLGDSGAEAATRLNIGVSFYWLGRHAEAVDVLTGALAMYDGTTDHYFVARAHFNLGSNLIALGDHRQARQHLDIARRLSREHALQLDGIILRELGQVYLADPDRESKGDALAAFEESLAFCRAHGDHEGEIQALNFLGETHALLGHVDAAVQHHRQALELAVQGQFESDVIVAHRHLSRLHEQQNDLSGALRHLREHTTLQHRRLEERAEQRSQQLMVRYRTEQALHQAQLAAKEAELQRLRNDELARALRALEQADREREALLRQLEHQAQHDQLTGLANRALFTVRVQQAVEGARACGRRASVLYLDLDGFKQVNDTLGHHAGDQLLREIATRLRACVAPGDTVARMGGDEFTVVLAAHDDVQHATRVAGRVLRAVHQPVTIEGRTVRISGSIGLAVYPDDGRDAQELQRLADTAMYTAKHAGKHAWHRHQPEPAVPADPADMPG